MSRSQVAGHVSSSLADVLARLDRSRARLRYALELVPPQLREKRPAEGRWSAAGVLEHLALVEERYASILARGIAAERAAASEGDASAVALLPPTIEALLADRSAPRTAPEPLHPQGMEWTAALERADAARVVLRQLLRDAGTRAWSRVIHEHPRFGALNVYQWGGFIAAHESRHAEQIREIATQMGQEP